VRRQEVVARVRVRRHLGEPGDRQQEPDELCEAERGPAEARQHVEERDHREQAEPDREVGHDQHDEAEPDRGRDCDARVDAGAEPEQDGEAGQREVPEALAEV
jgi:hypothetical protein